MPAQTNMEDQFDASASVTDRTPDSTANKLEASSHTLESASASILIHQKKAMTKEQRDLLESFTELTKVGDQIKTKKRELKALHKNWLALQEKVQPTLDDPYDDSE